MKNPLLIFLLFVSMASVKAQDKIITIKQDTIDCKIVSVNVERIAYEQKTPDNQVVGKSILTSDVLQYFRSGELNNFVDNNDHEIIKREPLAHRWLFSLQGGLAYSVTDYGGYENQLLNLGSSASNANDYTKKLKNGYHINTSLHYLVNTFLGLGVDYNLFYSASKGEFLTPGYAMMNVPIFTRIELDERMYAHFAGLSVLFQQFPDKNKRIKISETLSPGFVLFRSETRTNQYQDYSYIGVPKQFYDHSNSLSRSSCLAAKGGLSIEYVITPQLSAGLSGNFTWAKLNHITVKSPDTDIYNQLIEVSLNISHIDYGFTVRYNF